MTYRELIIYIVSRAGNNPDILDQDITILAADDLHESESYPVRTYLITTPDDDTDGLTALDVGHLVLIVEG